MIGSFFVYRKPLTMQVVEKMLILMMKKRKK